jgi:hypothetical protein
MFEYALGRYLAEKKGYELIADPLPFASTKDRISGAHYEEPQEEWEGHFFDLDKVLQDTSKRSIVLSGYFQQSWIYMSFWEQILAWYRPAVEIPPKLSEVDNNDLLIYVRLGDYLTSNLALSYQFYETAIEMAAPRRIYLVTEEPGHSFLDGFKRYAPYIFGGQDLISDMFAMRPFNQLVISCSTFSWWSAMLSQARKIYFPIGDCGVWAGSNCASNAYTHADLRVDHERFVYFYNCPTIRSGRRSSGHVQLEQYMPSLLKFHRLSKAFWFI